jgi:phage-related minor tail protein
MKDFGPALVKGAGSETDKAGAAVGKKFGTAIAIGVAATVGAVAAAGGALYKVGTVFSDVSTQISTNTGAAGKDLQALNDSAKRVGATMPRSFEDIGGAVASVKSSIGGLGELSEAEFDKATKNALNFSKAFEIDTDRVTQVVGQMMKTGLVGDANEAFDLLTAAAQKVPAAVREDVIDAIDEYGPFFSQLGIKGEDAMGMLVKASEKGMYGIDKTGDALKEFTIRATDMSTATAGAYKTLGLDTQQMTKDLLAGGDTGAAAFQKIVGGLNDIKDPVAQSQAALALFGTPLEDLSTEDIPKFISSLSGAQGALGETEGAAQRMGDNLNGGIANKLATFGNKVMIWLEPLATGFLSGLSSLFDELAGGITAFTGAWLANDGDITSSGFPGFMEQVAYWARQAFDVFQANVLPVLQRFGDYIIRSVIPAVRDFGNWVVQNKDWLIALGITVGTLVVGFQLWIGALQAWKTITAAVTTVQMIFNAVLAANPIGLVIIAIGALVAGLVWFFTQTELGQQIVTNVWGAIQAFIGGTVTWFQEYVLPTVQAIFAGVGAVFSWLYSNIIQPVFAKL